MSKIIVKDILFEDFINYKVPCMYIAFPYCTFKCGKELCQNSPLALSPNIEVEVGSIVDRYMANDITQSIVMAGLEPLDSFEELIVLVRSLRFQTKDPIVIFTGYNKEEIEDKLEELKKYSNIIIKFGRYIPNQKPHLDPVLGVKLASDNQYAEQIS